MYVTRNVTIIFRDSERIKREHTTSRERALHSRVPGSENGRASAESDDEGGGAAGSSEGHDVSDGPVGGVGSVATSPGGGTLENGQSSSGSSTGGNKARRRRTAFTSEQLLELEREFHAKKYLSLTERSHIAHALKLSEVQVSFT